MTALAPAYERFAHAYDRIMHNVDYQRWGDYIQNIFHQQNKSPKTILDIACGTGALTAILAEKDYHMTGVDLAEGMLDIARDKASNLGLSINLVHDDMRTFDLGQQFDVVLCTYDSINYMRDEEDFASVCFRVIDHLKPNGLFIFDVTTERNIVRHFHAQTFAENNDDYAYIWQNLYSKKEQVCRTTLTFFIKDGDLFRRFEELHVQRIFDNGLIKKMLKQCGYEVLGMYDMYTFNRPGLFSDRVNFVARRL